MTYLKICGTKETLPQQLDDTFLPDPGDHITFNEMDLGHSKKIGKGLCYKYLHMQRYYRVKGKTQKYKQVIIELHFKKCEECDPKW